MTTTSDEGYSKFRPATAVDVTAIAGTDNTIPFSMFFTFLHAPSAQFLVAADGGINAGYMILENASHDEQCAVRIQKLACIQDLWAHCIAYVKWLASLPPYPSIIIGLPDRGSGIIGARFREHGFSPDSTPEANENYRRFVYVPPNRPADVEVWPATKNRVARYFRK